MEKPVFIILVFQCGNDAVVIWVGRSKHYDVSSTTSPPVHPKPLPFPKVPQSAPCISGYTDDISALSASSLLKRYAERYSSTQLYQKHGSFLRSEQHPGAMAWRVQHRRASWFRPIEGERKWCSEQQYSGGPTSQDYPSSYSSQHLLPKPSYLPSPALPCRQHTCHLHQAMLIPSNVVWVLVTLTAPLLCCPRVYTPPHLFTAATLLPTSHATRSLASTSPKLQSVTIHDQGQGPTGKNSDQWWECQRKLWNGPPELQAW